MTVYILPLILSFLLVVSSVFYIYTQRKLKKKNEEYQILKREFDLQTQLSEDFISSLSHELRTPLYGVMGLTNLLADEYPQIKESRNFKSLKFSGDHLLNLINNVLQVNYLNSPNIAINSGYFSLKELCDNLISSFRYATENSGNNLHFNYDNAINSHIKADSAILTQILISLITNALRFTKNGNVYFSVNLIKDREHSYSVSFNVKHDGSGISTEDEKFIYREFLNVDLAKKTFLGSSVYGMIINRLAQALEGEIITKNEDRTGSEYILVCNFDKKTEQLSEEDSDKTEKLKVLIVDDNKLNLLVADKMLSQENFDCTTIDNGFDAIELVKDNTYDIILMDINMPKLNGIGTTKRIREFNASVPIIALTAVDVTQINRQILQAGLNDYILKPYDKKHLIELINKNLKLSSNS